MAGSLGGPAPATTTPGGMCERVNGKRAFPRRRGGWPVEGPHSGGWTGKRAANGPPARLVSGHPSWRRDAEGRVPRPVEYPGDEAQHRA